jgi:transaldolase
VIAEQARLGLDLDAVTTELVDEGVASFSKSFDDLLAVIKAKQPAAA